MKNKQFIPSSILAFSVIQAVSQKNHNTGSLTTENPNIPKPISTPSEPPF